MEARKRKAILLRQISLLRDKESWCGETHVQKACFFLQHLTKVPLDFDFILYRYGPFSFQLRDELTELRAVGYLDLVTRVQPYGPSLVLTARGEEVVERRSALIECFEEQMEFVAVRVGAKRVADLERLATALYLTPTDEPGVKLEERASELHRLKPHIPLQQARNAIETIDEWLREWTEAAPTGDTRE